jgi:hypothetical protein
MSKRKFATWMMTLMLLVSLYPILKIAVNEIYGLVYENTYSAEVIYDASDQWNYKGHRLEVVEQPSPRLLIDNHPFPILQQAKKTDSDVKKTLYETYIRSSAYVEVLDKEAKQKKLAVVQRFQDPDPGKVSDDRYRIIWVEDGKTEEFSTDERRSPVYRAGLMAFVSPSPVGWVDNVLYGWPGVVVPFLFPFGTFAISSIYLIRFISVRRKVS